MAISYNEPITFGRNGSAQRLNCNGIDFSEDGTQSWTNAPAAELDIQLPMARQDVLLEIEAAPFLIPNLVLVQNIFVFLGGLFTAFHALSSHNMMACLLNRNALPIRPTRLSLVIPTAVSPSSIGTGHDMRSLGICLESITFKTIA